MPRRSRRSLVLSLLLHAGFVVLANVAANSPAVSRPDSPTFVALHTPAREPLIPNIPEPVPEARPEPLIAPDLPESEVESVLPAPEPPHEPGPATRREVSALAEPPPAAEQELLRGGWEVDATAQAGEVVDSGFHEEVAPAPPLMERDPVVGVLDAPVNTQRTGRERLTATVTSTEFDRPTREPATVRPPQEVATRLAGFDAGTDQAGSVPGANQDVVTGVAGFGAPAAPEAEPQPAATGGIASGFAVDLPAAPAAGAAAPPGPPESPVEIEFKPTPEYSAEARAAGIEGNVLLRVEFSAAGVVRVLCVIEGLGYGLDALAVRAAEQMRFTPAERNGQPVDTRAVVSIRFRLA